MSTNINNESLASILTNGLNLGIVIVDEDYRIIFWNEWMEKQSGIETEKILGQNIFDKYLDIKARKKDWYISECIKNNRPFLLSSYFHEYLIPINIVKGDETICMLQNVKIYPLIRDRALSNAVIIIEDVTNRVFHEKEMLRLSRVLKGIRNVNQLITRVNSEKKLFNGVCKILIHDIGYAFAWIGLTEKESFDVKPVAFAGIEPELLEELKVKWDDSKYGLGVTGKAIKTGKPQRVDLIQKDFLSKPWHDFADKAGYNSSCSLPLNVDGSVIGTISVHSVESMVFYGEELRLLEEVADDISFAIMTLRERQKRRLAEETLAIEKERLAVTLRSIGDGVIATDINGNVLLMNAVAEDLTGWTEEEAYGKSINKIFHIINEHTREQCENPVKKALATGMVIDLANNTVLISRDGREFVIGDSGALIRDREGKTIGVVLVFRDMTEKIKLEADLRQSQKMESIGTIAGGIAHDFNNIIGIIIGNVELAMNDIPEWNPAKGCLEEIRSASMRAKDVVQHILSFARKSLTKRKPIKITSIIKDSLKLMRASIPATIEISQNFTCENDTVFADPTQINQVLINLCTNASHAMREEGGILEVSLQNVELETRNDELGLEPGIYVKLFVSDTGPGVDSTVINRIFDPYFTTKGLGEGTGMGLSIVHGIVKNHDGAITVKSKPGKGAVFEVLFPLTEAEPEPEPEDNKGIALPTGKDKILFVDDEASLLKTGRKMLERLGYQVETKSNPIEALDLVRSDPDRFDLIITDMTMPQMTGEKLAKEILNIRSDMPIILCTGFSDKIDNERAKQLGISKYIEKPLTIPDFTIAVRKVLDKE